MKKYFVITIMYGRHRLRVVHVHKKSSSQILDSELYAGKMAKRDLTWLAILVRAFCLMLLMAYKHHSKFMYFNVPILILA